MSTHFIHKFKHSHEIRRKFFNLLIKNKDAAVIAKFRNGFLVKTTNNQNYRISSRGRVIKL